LFRLCLVGDFGEPGLKTKGSEGPILVAKDGLPNSGWDGDIDSGALYGGRLPLTRSGESGKSGVPGEANFSGGGSISWFCIFL
jgi:hypothetical protein